MRVLAIGMACVAACALAAAQETTPAGRSGAQTEPPSQRQPGGNPSAPEFSGHFADGAARYAVAQIRFGQMAQKMAFSVEVNDFANRMIGDSMKLEADLKQLAQQEGLTLPQRMTLDELALEHELEGKQQEAFDTHYMLRETQFVREMADAARLESKEGRDPLVRALAAKVLPMLESEMSAAAQTNAKVDSRETTPRAKNR